MKGKFYLKNHKNCGEIIHACCAKEPPHVEAPSCLDTDLTPDIRKLQQLVIPLHHKSHFVVLLDRFPTQNTEWS